MKICSELSWFFQKGILDVCSLVMSGDVTDQGGLQTHSLENNALKSGCDFLYNVPSDGKCASQAYKINHSDLSTDCVALRYFWRLCLLPVQTLQLPSGLCRRWEVLLPHILHGRRLLGLGSRFKNVGFLPSSFSVPEGESHMDLTHGYGPKPPFFWTAQVSTMPVCVWVGKMWVLRIAPLCRVA